MDNHYNLLITIIDICEFIDVKFANQEKLAVRIHKDKITENELEFYHEETKIRELLGLRTDQYIADIETINGCITV